VTIKKGEKQEYEYEDEKEKDDDFRYRSDRDGCHAIGVRKRPAKQHGGG
jgi:hypothetical protein